MNKFIIICIKLSNEHCYNFATLLHYFHILRTLHTVALIADNCAHCTHCAQCEHCYNLATLIQLFDNFLKLSYFATTFLQLKLPKILKKKQNNLQIVFFIITYLNEY